MSVLIFGSVSLLIAVGLKIWYKSITGICKSNRRMDGKTVIVTGANTGIGKETALDLARRGARVILACRDMKRGKEALDDIIATTGNKNVVLHKLDLASLTSVREFAKTIIKTENCLDVLINNAGAIGLPDMLSVDGIQMEMQINHLGPFLLTILLLDLLKKSAPSRIIMLSSGAHYHSNLQVDHLKTYGGFQLYGNTKLCNILFANELARKLKGTGVTSNSVHPGAVSTDVGRNMPRLAQLMIFPIFKLFIKNAVEGAQTTIYLAVSEEVEGVTGKYFVDCKEAPTSKAAQDEGLAKKIWEKSEDLVGLKPSEKFALG